MIIHKQSLPPGAAQFSLVLPAGATVLSVKTQDGTPVIWYSFKQTATKVERRFFVANTGQSFSDRGTRYVGTFQIESVFAGALVNRFVGHLFEVVEQ